MDAWKAKHGCSSFDVIVVRTSMSHTACNIPDIPNNMHRYIPPQGSDIMYVHHSLPFTCRLILVLIVTFVFVTSSRTKLLV